MQSQLFNAVDGVITNNSHAPAAADVEAPVRTLTHPTPLLFEDDPVTFELPQLAHHPLDDALDELEILGFPLCNPFDLVEDRWGVVAVRGDLPAGRHGTHRGDVVGEDTNHGVGNVVRRDLPDGRHGTHHGMGAYVPAARMHEYLGQTITMLGYHITWKPVHTVKKEMMYFGTYIDAAGDWLDTVHFPDSAKAYPLQGRGFYRMTGTVVEEFGVFNLEVGRMEKLGIKDRAAIKAGSLLEKDKSWKQGLIVRE